MFRFIFVLVLICLHSTYPKNLPSYIHKCSKSDPNFNKCLDRNAQEAVQKLKNGNEDLGIVSLEPFYLDKVDLGNMINGTISLHQVYTNMKIFGMTVNTTLTSDANFNGDDCYWNYKSTAPMIRMKYEYVTKGQVMNFPINSHGNCTNYLYDVEGNYGAKCERYIRKSKIYLRVTDLTFDIKPKKFLFDCKNIIDGNQQLSEKVVKNAEKLYADVDSAVSEVLGTVVQTLNERENVYSDVGRPFSEAMATAWKQTLNQVFSMVPEDELFLP